MDCHYQISTDPGLELCVSFKYSRSGAWLHL